MSKSIIAVLTGGGCAPGLDPFIEAFTKLMIKLGYQVLGIKYGWEGLLGNKPNFVELTKSSVEGKVRSGGTMIGTSRDNPLQNDKSTDSVINNLNDMGVVGLVAAGGDNTQSVSVILSRRGFNVISVPKTIDRDLSGTDYTIGFWSYCEAVFSNCLPGYIETLRAHKRVGVVEVFGRKSGFTAVAIGIAGNACYIAIPESVINIDCLLSRVKEFYDSNEWALVVVGEAVEVQGKGSKEEPTRDSFGEEVLFERGTGSKLAKLIQEKMDIEARSSQATHPFRGTLSVFDAFMGYRIGIKAAQMVSVDDWGMMVSVQNDELKSVPIELFEPRRVITTDSWWQELVTMRNMGLV